MPKMKRDGLRQWVRKLKMALGCSKCGYWICARALHFHHKDPETKNFEISRACTNKNRAQVLEELAKCRVLCANCHAEEEEETYLRKEDL